MTLPSVSSLCYQHSCSAQPSLLPAAVEYRTPHGTGSFYLYAGFAQPLSVHGMAAHSLKFLQTDDCWHVLAYCTDDESSHEDTEEQTPCFVLSFEELAELFARFDIHLPAAP